jgi:hypothetical protein
MNIACEMEFHLRASSRAYVSLVGSTSIPLILSVLLIIRGSSDAIEFAAWSALLPIFAALWLAAFRLDVDGIGLSYHGPFFHRTRLLWSEIASLEVKQGLGKRSSQVDARFARIIVRAVREERTLVINPRPFPLRSLDACVDLMKARIAKAAK